MLRQVEVEARSTRLNIDQLDLVLQSEHTLHFPYIALFKGKFYRYF